MAKKDWASLQRQYAREYGKYQTPPKAWCELNGLRYETAKRHIHIPDEEEIARAENEPPPQEPPRPRKKVGTKEVSEQSIPRYQVSMPEVIGGSIYSRRMLIPDDLVEDAKSMTLYDELHRLRVANLMAADSIGKYRSKTDDASAEEIAALEEAIATVTKTMNMNAVRMESLEKTISYLNGDRMIPRKIQADIEYRIASTEKVIEEVEAIRNGENGTDPLVVHNMLPMPEAG